MKESRWAHKDDGNVSFEETNIGNLFGGFSFDEKSQDGLTKTISNVSMESQDREFKKPWTRDEAQWYVEFSFFCKKSEKLFRLSNTQTHGYDREWIIENPKYFETNLSVEPPTIERVSSGRVVESISFSQDTNNSVLEEESFSFTGPSSLSDNLKQLAMCSQDLSSSELKSQIKQAMLGVDAKRKLFLKRLSICLQESVKCDNETLSEWIPQSKLKKMDVKSLQSKITRYTGEKARERQKSRLNHRFRECFLKSAMLRGQRVELDAIKDPVLRKFVGGEFFFRNYSAAQDYNEIQGVEQRFLAYKRLLKLDKIFHTRLDVLKLLLAHQIKMHFRFFKGHLNARRCFKK